MGGQERDITSRDESRNPRVGAREDGESGGRAEKKHKHQTGEELATALEEELELEHGPPSGSLVIPSRSSLCLCSLSAWYAEL
jgi:hypothetical protein